MMKKPDYCHMATEKCEDCKYWEPIPFHHNGGICRIMMRNRKTGAPTYTAVEVETEKKLVKR